MKKFCFVSILLLCFSLCSCGIFVDTNTAKSSELSEKYNFYENSVASIRSGCNVSPEEADEIFLVLVNDCGVDKELTVTPYINAPYSVKYGAKTLSMTLDDNTVSEVLDGDKQIFPATTDDAFITEESNILNDTEAPTENVQQDDDFVTTDVTVSNDSENEVSQPESTEDNIRLAIEDVVGPDNLVTFNYVPDNNFSLIKFNGNENLTDKMTVNGMYLDIFEILKSIQPIVDTNVDFNVVYPLRDVYGNTTDTIVIKATFKKETIKKINFDNAIWENIPIIADEWWNHDAVNLTN